MNDKPYFEFEGEEIITFPDPPHLLKCFRNLFMTYDVKLLSFASWKHIEQFIELDNSNPHFVFAPKHHIQPNGKEKMRVKLAAQIFSHSVAMGIYSKASTNELPAGAVATATFLEHFNNLFDLLNANAPDRQEGSPSSPLDAAPHAVTEHWPVTEHSTFGDFCDPAISNDFLS
ncbi:hypothetical protein ABMA28_009250 [Loxostege sticticalis]|uniref:Transposable element P transposase-like GTP-binding insertion domain-containing protein n=1 Tax=Loxostege sticticalis TaxID=481309 RepID=A0ABD0SCQ0_LOXSC